jgi:hypothetical protein
LADVNKTDVNKILFNTTGKISQAIYVYWKLKFSFVARAHQPSINIITFEMAKLSSRSHEGFSAKYWKLW